MLSAQKTSPKFHVNPFAVHFLVNFLPVALFVFILELPVVGVCTVSSLNLKWMALDLCTTASSDFTYQNLNIQNTFKIHGWERLKDSQHLLRFTLFSHTSNPPSLNIKRAIVRCVRRTHTKTTSNFWGVYCHRVTGLSFGRGWGGRKKQKQNTDGRSFQSAESWAESWWFRATRDDVPSC